jgi:hypothetical protein
MYDKLINFSMAQNSILCKKKAPGLGPGAIHNGLGLCLNAHLFIIL